MKEDVKYIKEVREATEYDVDLIKSDSVTHNVSRTIKISF
jgi:hypothetical protein